MDRMGSSSKVGELITDSHMAAKLKGFLVTSLNGEQVVLAVGLRVDIQTARATLKVAIQGVRKGAAAKGMKMKDYVWRSLDCTLVAVITEVACCMEQISTERDLFS